VASEQAIAEVRENLPDDAGWNDEKIGQVLDTFSGKVSRAVRSFWAKTAANTASLIDISESGSSRTLSKQHDNAVAQVKYWDGIIAEENAVATSKLASFSRTMKRV
jgi:hypothetical protein